MSRSTAHLASAPPHPPHPSCPLGRRLGGLPVSSTLSRGSHRADARRRCHGLRHLRPTPRLRTRRATEPAVYPLLARHSSRRSRPIAPPARLRHPPRSPALPLHPRAHSCRAFHRHSRLDPSGVSPPRSTAISWQDRTLGVVSLVGLSFPNFALGPILILIFSIQARLVTGLRSGRRGSRHRQPHQFLAPPDSSGNHVRV